MKNNEVVLYEAKANASTNVWGNISSTAIVVVPTLIPLCVGSLSSTLITLGITSAISFFALSLKRASLTSNLYNSAFLTLMPEGEDKKDFLSYPGLYRSEREAYLNSEVRKYNRQRNFRSFLKKLFLGKATYMHNESTIDAYGSVNRKMMEIDSQKIVIVDRKTESDLAIWLNAVKNAYMLDPNFDLREAKREEQEEQEERYMHQMEKIADAKRKEKRQAEHFARIAMDKEKIKFQKLAKSTHENLKTAIRMHRNSPESESAKTINIRSGVLDQDTIENAKNNAKQLEQMMFERGFQHQKDAEKLAEQKRHEANEEAKIAREKRKNIVTDADISKMERADRYRQLYIDSINRHNAALDYENALVERLVEQSRQ